MVAQYISRAKVLLERIHNTSKMCKILGVSYDKLYLVRGLHSSHAQWRVASEQDTLFSMEDIIQTIERVTRSEEQNKTFFNPKLEVLRPVIQVNEVSSHKAMGQYRSNCPNNNQPTQCGFIILSEKTICSQGVHLGKAQDSQPISMVLRKYCATTVMGST